MRLDSARAKLDWAKQYGDTLYREVEAFHVRTNDPEADRIPSLLSWRMKVESTFSIFA
jgi:hypothetical protein